MKIMNMKTNSIEKVHVDQELLNEIRAEVKETIAEIDLAMFKPRRKFAVVDMWNIHRKRKQASTRRYL
ncbi:MAG: hypothetical protein K0Q66_2089 [Chitinophagaceae bacterium]|nr:hypothetical protein [Chitinophagaceae bacterium]